MLADAWRLGVGTLSAIPVTPPGKVDRARAGLAALVAPLAVLPAGLLLALLVWAGLGVGLSPLVVATLAVALGVLSNRGIHLDGLADSADGLAASHDRERSLSVMKSGVSGPAGVAAVVLVLLAQTAGLAMLIAPGGAEVALMAATVFCISRVGLAWCCVHGIPAARPDGLGVVFTGSVGRFSALGQSLVAAGLLAAAATVADLDWWRGPLALAVAGVVAGVLLRRTVTRFGGVTGDVFGACIELCFAALIVALSA